MSSFSAVPEMVSVNAFMSPVVGWVAGAAGAAGSANAGVRDSSVMPAAQAKLKAAPDTQRTNVPPLGAG